MTTLRAAILPHGASRHAIQRTPGHITTLREFRVERLKGAKMPLRYPHGLFITFCGKIWKIMDENGKVLLSLHSA
jgi:hypothetical protein